MDESAAIQIVAIIILIICSSFFSGTETAFSSFSRVRMKNYANAGDKRASRVLKISDRFDSALSALLIGNNIVNIASASIGTILFTKWFPAYGAMLSTVVLTIVVLIFGEVLPKSLAKRSPEERALRSSGILWVCMKVFSPFVFCLQAIVKLFSKDEDNQPSVTEEELKVIIEEIEDEGVLNEHESELVQSAIEFDDITVDEILTPRVDVAAVSTTEDPQAVLDLFFSTGYSRLPVYEKTIDNILGVITQKDFVQAYLKQNGNVSVIPLIQKVLFVPPKKRISSLLKELQHEVMHMAVVTDSYGGTIGIITIEDIIEELVGDIWDESDQVKTEIVLIGENTYRVDGDTNVFDLFEYLDMEDCSYDGSSQSVGGWALDMFEHIPQENESFTFEALTVRVETVTEQRITSLIVQKKPECSDEENE